MRGLSAVLLRLVLAGLVLSCATFATAEQFGLLTYRIIDGAAVEITAYPTSETGDLAIPSEINDLPVTRIGDRAFFTCGGLTSVTIPEGVTQIGHEAFGLCPGLSGVDLANRRTATVHRDSSMRFMRLTFSLSP